ncbi:MAG: tetratricopeptide repeat protein, partial [Syntrophobacterales bacterium]
MDAKRLIIIAMTLCVVAGQALGAGEIIDEFKMANNFYEKKDYDSAIRLYESILNQGKESDAIYFNLGNAYFKKGDLGHAILNYLKAKRLNPADEDIRHNLEFARRFSRVQMEGVELNPINSFFSSIVDSYRFRFLVWLTSACFILLMLILIVRYGIGINNGAVRVVLVLLVLALITSSGLTSFKYRQDYATKRAVIVAEESSVYTGPSDQSGIELEAAPGLIVEI